MFADTVVGMHGEGFPWPLILMLAILVLAIIGIIFLTRYLLRPVAVGNLSSVNLVNEGYPQGASPLDDVERDTFVVIPDISGYTQFMQLTRFAAGHAKYIMVQLLDELITSAHPPLLPTRVEGDSVMFYAVYSRDDPEEGASGSSVASAVHNMVIAFYRRRDELLASNLCPCEACQYITGLDLKVVVHRGDVVRYRLRGLEDLSGMAVIEAHRLLKNSVGRDRYVLVSEAAAKDVRLSWKRSPEMHWEHYDGVGEVGCDLYIPEEQTEPASDTAKSPVRDMAGKFSSNLKTITGTVRRNKPEAV